MPDQLIDMETLLGAGYEADREPASGGEVYALPATQGQIRFWSLDRLNPGNPALNMPLMWQFTGPLEVDLLLRAFDQCLARHEMLRTTFALVDGSLCQIVQPELRAEIPLDDLTGLSGEARRREADRLTREHAALRMDLSAGPLLRLRLLKLDAARHLLLVTMHHIICDGISNGILMRDMVECYKALLAGAAPTLPELPIQFADYAIWNEQWRSTPEHEAALAFWRDSLGTDFTPLRLEHDADAAEALTGELAHSTGEIETLLIPRELAARAHGFCHCHSVTLNVLLFSVFSALMSRLTGQLDLAIGSPCANRTEDTQELIGLFMNIQVLRVRLKDDSRFTDLLQQLQRWTLGACENQALPFEDLVHDPFFAQGAGSFQLPIFFLYQRSFMVTARIPAPAGTLEIVPLRSESPGAVFELMFAIVDREEEGPRLQLEYNPRQFKAATIQRYLRLYVNLLDAAITAPETEVRALTLLSADERAGMLESCRRTAADFGAYEPFHHAFLRRASEHPEQVAALCGTRQWSYGELAEYARSVALRLLHRGAGPGTLVALCMERSLEMLGSMLGVMLAGAAYVPLDPRSPRERLERVLEDSGAALLLTNGGLDLPAGAEIVDLHSEEPVPQAELPRMYDPHALAYVIYTSGSTGRPKGVAIEHGSLMNLLRSMQREPGLAASDVLVAVTTVAFDIAALELLLPLLVGARLVIATEEQVHQPAQLLALLEQSRATVLQATPGAWRVLIDQGWTGKEPLKVLCGGESMSRELANRLLDRSDSVWNMYGPTETTIWSSATRVTPGVKAPRLGEPIANTQFHVLDGRRAPLPAGVDGELYIGGAGLARGYWNHAAQTEQSFLESSFGAGRIYKTGDLARRHGDDTIELLGRADFQVKVRGYRIELGEIESALEGHAKVRESVVVQHVLPDRPGVAGVTRLVAYVDAGAHADAAESAGLIDELKSRLAHSLPDYMRPNAIVVLRALPRLLNGKIDRKALPEVFEHAGDSGIRRTMAEPESFVEPRDVIERQLAEIWQSTLGIAKISIRASFFSLGVGSLAALRLITRMNRVYAMDLGLASLISASSIESLAELIRSRFAPNTASSIVPIQPMGTRTPLFIVHGVGGNVVNFYGLSMRMGADQPVYGIQSQALVADAPALLHLTDMAAHYIQELRKVQPDGPYKLLGYSFGGTVVLEMAHQLRAAGQEVAMVGMLDSKSRDYEEQRSRTLSVHSRIGRRLTRLRGNTGHLQWRERLRYMTGKFTTRAIRFSCMAAARMNISRVPAFMKSAYDINYVAVQNYTMRPYGGRLTLFRATEQDDGSGPYDLGWSAIFSEGVEIHDLPGDHERIFLEPNIDVLAGTLRECLRRAAAQ